MNLSPLTREAILALPAGKELDILLFHHVFGQSTPPSGCVYGPGAYFHSTDPAKSAAVVEKMAEKGFWLKLYSPFEAGQPWWAAFDKHGITDSNPPWQAPGDKGPHATGLAALLAVLEL